MAGFRAGRRRDAVEPQAPDVELARRAGSALIAADERLRGAIEELGFAEAELGADATGDLGGAIVQAQALLTEAFRLNQPGPGREAARHRVRVVQLCDEAAGLLDEHTSALAERMARARRAPEIVAAARGDIERLRSQVPEARELVERLAARYSRAALAGIEGHPAEAAQLLGFAEHSAAVAERRRSAGQHGAASIALEASVDAVHRAATLLDAVDDFEVEALQAESRLGALVDESRRRLAAALAESRRHGVADAIDELRAALAAIPAVGVNTDPIAHLERLRSAGQALDAAITGARERAARPVPSASQLRRAVADADRVLDRAREVVAGHPGVIGAEAQDRFARAEHLRLDLRHHLDGCAADAALDDAHRGRAMGAAERIAGLASEAVRAARRDIRAAARPVERTGGRLHRETASAAMGSPTAAA
ncbi:hypothetical protein ACFPER_02345 [Agromyces aurantiacus]|uniref:Uncharacterized protein n=1 Tax=Agromyces aurantiacus TaxID=165814 RepID=A0ABV9R0K5_9MICO|nr:hypothetical protein [Agromyces aurantiacus]MBM7505927.1 hypothetical protein [Agromyces aurantiacus]